MSDIVGKRVRELREAHRISQEELVAGLAKLVPSYPVSRQQVSSIEVGRSGASEDFIQAVCEFFNVSADYVLGWVERPLPPGHANFRAGKSPRRAD